MAKNDDDWPEDWEQWLDDGLELDQVPLETPEHETVPVAFRAYFDEINATGFGARTGTEQWWLMASRLRAFELLRTNDLIADIRPTYIEWRVRV
jgi:hypothetical protein